MKTVVLKEPTTYSGALLPALEDRVYPPVFVDETTWHLLEIERRAVEAEDKLYFLCDVYSLQRSAFFYP
jgi:hypothetical protein